MKKTRKLLGLLLVFVMAVSLLSACGSSSEETTEAPAETTAAAEETTAAAEETTEKAEETTAAPAEETTEAPEETTEAPEEDDEENYDTGDASLDNIRNQDDIGEKELLVLSFGTSFNDSRRLTIGAIEGALEEAIPEYSVRRGFTANIIIDHVERRDGILIDDVDAALQRAVDNGVKTLVVQPTHLMAGLEYDEICDQIAGYADKFDQVVISDPLLTSDDDFKRVEQAIVDWTKEYDDGETAIVFMGHGTEHESNKVYQQMQDLLAADGYKNYFIGTVEATPSLEDVLAAVKDGGYKKVILEPLMVVAGDHANNDMAAEDDPESWYSAFTAEGFEVTCLLRGLGENEAIREIYVEHAKAAIAKAEGGEAEEPEEDEEEDYTTGDASLDNIRNQDDIGENELLVLSFGTSFNDSRRLTIGAIEGALEKAIPEYSVRRGFTANIIIDHVQRRDGILIDDVEAALERAVNNGVKNLVVQPTHLMAGLEYDEICDQIAGYADKFDQVVISDPLLTSDDDFKRVEQAIVDWTKEYDDGETAIVFMGHGTEHESNKVYQQMQDLLAADGYKNYFIGTVEATPSLEDVLAAVKDGGYKKVILEPLMVVAGDHANNDMAAEDDPESWYSAFTAEGFEVTCLLRGLGENEAIQQIYVEHAQAAVAKVK